MKLSSIEGNDEIKRQLDRLEQSNRFPHAIIINSGSTETRAEICSLLARWAVCGQSDRPCGECAACNKAREKKHPDIYYAKGTGKTDVISVDEIRKIVGDSVLIPNEAQMKVYIFEDADIHMGIAALNALLMTLEEPVRDTLFLLTTADAGILPATVLSRCTVLELTSRQTYSDEILALSRELLTQTTAVSELPLLKSFSALSSKNTALPVLEAMRLVLSDALALSVGSEGHSGDDTAAFLRQRLTRAKLIALIDCINDAIYKINRNANMTLVSTWLCGEFRRITWQK